MAKWLKNTLQDGVFGFEKKEIAFLMCETRLPYHFSLGTWVSRGKDNFLETEFTTKHLMTNLHPILWM